MRHMAKGKKTGGRSFEPGNKANPKGGGAISASTRAIRKITLEHIQDVADVILDGNIDKLKALAADPNTSVLKVWIAKAAATGIQKGDLHSLDAILNRVLGKPKETVEHGITKEVEAVGWLMRLTPEQRQARIDALKKNRKDES
jgi:hypothetical protein